MAPGIIFELILLSLSFILAQVLGSYWILLIPIAGLFLIISSFFAFYWAPFVSSNNAKVVTMIELAKIKKGERVYDLGAGNGKIINAAARKGAVATGFEISIPLVIYYYLKRLLGFVKGEVLWGNFFKKDISDADIVFCYLLSSTMSRVYQRLYKNLRPGTRVISNAFPIKELEPTKKVNEVFLYIVK